tara:strand:+ start:16451 stop:17170 length:720 start_codon:yes stop_codon:yes gene_type:complete
MSDIAKDLFKSIVTDTASAETFSAAMNKKLDQALDVRKAGIAAAVYGGGLEEVVEESTKNKLLAKDLEKLIKNPDPSRVKQYGGTKYVDMLKIKLAKLQEDNTDLEEAIKWWTVTITKKTGKLLKGQTVDVKASNPAQAIKKGLKQMKADPMTVPSDSVNVVLGESIEEAKLKQSDLDKVIKFASKIGKAVNKDTVDMGGAKIKFTVDKGRIKFDGGKSAEVTYFDNLEDAIATLDIVS